jgi:hypothetical protein
MMGRLSETICSLAHILSGNSRGASGSEYLRYQTLERGSGSLGVTPEQL